MNPPFTGIYYLDYLSGSRVSLQRLVGEYLSQGGCDFPEMTRAESKEAEAASDKIVYLAYFEEPGCKDCDRVNDILRSLERAYASLEIRRLSSEKKEDIELF